MQSVIFLNTANALNLCPCAFSGVQLRNLLFFTLFFASIFNVSVNFMQTGLVITVLDKIVIFS